MSKKVYILLGIILLIFAFQAGAFWANKNNPYGANTWVKTFFSTSVDKEGQLKIKKVKDLHFINTPFGKVLFYIQAFFRIEGNVRNPETPFFGTEQAIINQIYGERFILSAPYVISGGHFAELYVRNFGIFYSAMVDNRIPSSESDWLLRERVTLQTVATDLEILKQAKKEYTTFIPIGPNTFVGANFNANPSDSFFAVVYTLSALNDSSFISNIFPSTNTPLHNFQTKNAAQELIHQYGDVLSSGISAYLSEIIDPKTGIIKKNILLSSAMDSVKRKSSFYDNVIAWSTAKMATDLGLQIKLPYYCHPEPIRHAQGEGSSQQGLKEDSSFAKGDTQNDKNKIISCNFEKWKQNIISAFWDEKDGIFIDDLSIESKSHHLFSADSLIVTSSQFFEFTNMNDRTKLFRMITYVQKNNLDKPLPVWYAKKDRPDHLFFFVRYFATSYMGESIFSHWGIEYIKSLILISSDNPSYIDEAKKYLAEYSTRMKKYGGYPEVYDKFGNIYQTPFYKSVLHTGWVINYEQAKMMLNSTVIPAKAGI